MIRLVSADATGRAAGDSWQPSISDDGSRVAFMSYSPELRGAGGYFTSEIYVRHLISATTTKITPSSPADLPNLFPAISGDGRFVAFGSTEIPDGDASEPAPGGGAYIRDTAAAGPITRLDRRSPDAIFTETIGIALDYDGDTAVMQTNASHTTDDGNGVHDVYLIRRGARPELVSRGLSGLAGDAASSDPSIDGAGEVIAFTSRARDMGVANSIRQADVFTWAATEGIRLVSAPASGGRTSRESLNGQVSADGRSVAFTSFVQLVADDADGGLGDVYLHDRADRSLRVVSLDAAGGHIWQYAELESVSGNGSLVAFRTVWQLVPKDTSWNDVDVYVRDVVSGSVTLLG